MSDESEHTGQPSESSDAELVPGTVVEDGVSEPEEAKKLTDRIATSLREGDPMGAGAAVLSSMPISSLREYWLIIATFAVLVTILITFRTVLLPFILALALVYLMEPIVGWIGKSEANPNRLPRWAAVIIVYLTFITTVTVTVVLVTPRFVTEIVGLAETIPQEIQKFRTQKLPGVNARVQTFLQNYLPVAPEAKNEAAPAQAIVKAARRDAARKATALQNAKSIVNYAYDLKVVSTIDVLSEGEPVTFDVVRRRTEPPALFEVASPSQTGGWVYVDSGTTTISLTPASNGGMEIDLNEVTVEVEAVAENRWVIRKQRDDGRPIEGDAQSIAQLFNLEKTLDDLLQDFASVSNERLAQLIDFLQKLIIGIVGAFVGVMLTLMVAAFISMDLPRMMAFFRGFVPKRAEESYDVLIARLDKGLAGVVRGQLLICLINGILTWFGLYLLDVKFQVLLGVVAGILSLIPVFGTVISTIPICLIALTNSFTTGLLALAWILFIHAVEANLLNPKIIGESAHIHPVIVIFALLAGESAFGLVGALLAVPTASIVLTLFDFIRTRGWKDAVTEA